MTLASRRSRSSPFQPAPARRRRGVGGILALCGLAAALCGCTRPPPSQHVRVETTAPAPVVAPPPLVQPIVEEFGKASFYGPGFADKKTASGQRLAPSAMAAASKTLPLGTVVKVTNVENGKSARVVIVDRGPYKRGRIIDVTAKAAAKLGMVKKGVAAVKVETLAKPQPAAEEVTSK